MRKIIAALVSALVVSGASADDRAYSVDTNEDLLLLNFTTGTKSVLGNLGAVGTIESLAHDPATGLVYAVNSVGQFYHIIPSSATATLIGSLGTGNIEALDMLDGRLIGIGFAEVPEVYEIDPATGGVTVLSVASAAIPGRARGLAMQSATEGLVGDVDTLSHLDFDTGTLTPIGPMGVSGIYCMDEINGTLYAASSTGGEYYKIDPGTGAATLIGNFGPSWYLGLAPIEELEGDWAYSNDNLGNFIALNFGAPSATILGNTGAVTGNFIECTAYDNGSGMVYAINSIGQFFEIDPVTAAATLIGSTGLGDVEAMDSVDGVLLAFSFSNPTSMYEIDKATGAPTLITTGVNPMTSVPSAAAIRGDTAFLWDRNNLVEFDMVTGVATTIGGPMPSMHGMDFINGTLYGANGGGELFKIDETTGTETSLGVVTPGFLLSVAGIDTEAGPVVFVGELDADSFLWDRITDTGFIPGPCGGSIALDSYNDRQPYDEYGLRVINPLLPVTIVMRSLEPSPMDFDPFLAIYCDDFRPYLPLENVFETNDDESGTSQTARIEIELQAGRDYALVASSYASYAPARDGMYELEFINAEAWVPCLPDINGDGILDIGDIKAYVELFTVGDLDADMNGDGFLDIGDISTFVSLFTAGC